MLNALVFDFDGVIVDSEPLHYRAFVRVAKSLGFEMTWDRYLSEFVGYDDRDAFRVILSPPTPGTPGTPAPGSSENSLGTLGHPEKLPGVEERLPELIQQKARAFELEVNQGVQTIPGAVQLIAELAGELPIAISSGATQLDIRIILAKLGLDNVFDVTVTADDVKRSKPDPESYAKAVRLLAEKFPEGNITPGTSLAIEDTAAGICSAKAAGLQVLGLTTTWPAERLQEATRVIPNLQGLTLPKLQEWFTPTPGTPTPGTPTPGSFP